MLLVDVAVDSCFDQKVAITLFVDQVLVSLVVRLGKPLLLADNFVNNLILVVALLPESDNAVGARTEGSYGAPFYSEHLSAARCLIRMEKGKTPVSLTTIFRVIIPVGPLKE